MRRVAVLLLAAVAARAAAATFVVPSVEELSRASDLVVRGRVVAMASRGSGRGIVTDVDVRVASAWKGAPDATVRFVVPGGRAGGLALRVDSAPRFALGEDVVVFLSRSGPSWRVNGQALGAFRVEGSEARPAVEGTLLVPRTIAAGERRVGPMDVGELERRVRTAR
jgi:hypothetical protein